MDEKNIRNHTCQIRDQKGLKNKNIKVLRENSYLLDNKRGKKSKEINKLIVSTDKKIATIARKYNVEVPFLRPKDISKDHQVPSNLRHAINYYKKRKIFFDYLSSF